MLVLLNRERTSRRLPALEVDPTLTEVARDHSREMIALDYFSHTSPVHGALSERLEKTGLRKWEMAGENLAGAPDCEEAHNALFQSPEHRANILDPSFTHVGIGVVDGGPYGKMFTQDFVKHAGATAGGSSGQEIGTEVSLEAPSGAEEPSVASIRVSGVGARRTAVDGNILLLLGSLLLIEVLLRILEDKRRRYAFLQALGQDWHFVANNLSSLIFSRKPSLLSLLVETAKMYFAIIWSRGRKATRNSELGIRNSKLEISNSKIGIRN